jgi:hypothetical protein
LQTRPRVQSKIYLPKVWNTEQNWSVIRCRYIDNHSLSPKVLRSLNVCKVL